MFIFSYWEGIWVRNGLALLTGSRLIGQNTWQDLNVKERINDRPGSAPVAGRNIAAMTRQAWL